MHQHHETVHISPEKHTSSHTPKKEATPEFHWTEEEAVDFECARETLGHMVSICMALLYDEENPLTPKRRKELDEKCHFFGRWVQTLRLKDSETIERINREYGQAIKGYHSGGKCPV